MYSYRITFSNLDFNALNVGDSFVSVGRLFHRVTTLLEKKFLLMSVNYLCGTTTRFMLLAVLNPPTKLFKFINQFI